MSSNNTAIKCNLCDNTNYNLIATLNLKPQRETDFKIKKYFRSIYFCNSCKVYFNSHDYDLDKIYSGKYNKATYNNKIKEKYEKIMGLPLEFSDNKGRVKRVIDFLKANKKNLFKTKVLDVGSGLCVFLGELKKQGPEIHCIDPDELSTQHAIDTVGVISAHTGTLDDYKTNIKFDLITFNKVLEHIKNPVEALIRSKSFLKKDGIIYLELPNAKGAKDTNDFVNREEFFIEHHYIFTKDSLRYLIKKAGYKFFKMDEVHEPSDKYTLFAFIVKESE
jgi:2-polyprenyl-3-methyl-5-hydroxy-6-metoxy-1,4-benzoquinol methylase